MRLATLTSLLLPALAASHVLIPRPASLPATAILPTATPTNVPASTVLPPPPPAPTTDPNLELREIVNGVGAVLTQSDSPVVSTQWVETTIKGVKTWVAVIYTQTFAQVPDQLPTYVGKGDVGLGTLTGKVGVTKTVAGGAIGTAVAGGWRKNMVAAGVVAVGLMV